MTRSEMLKHLGLTDEEFQNLLLKFRVFYASLTASERAVVNRLIPKFKHVAGLFGGDVSRDDMKKFLAPETPPSPVGAAPPPAPPPPPSGVTAFGQNGINQITNGDGDGNGNGGQ
jgi:hypothetical protein